MCYVLASEKIANLPSHAHCSVSAPLPTGAYGKEKEIIKIILRVEWTFYNCCSFL